jgi:subtilisin family serine protease
MMIVGRLRFPTLVAALVLALSTGPIDAVLGYMAAANAQTPSYRSKTGATLDFLLSQAKQEARPLLAGRPGMAVATVVGTQTVNVSIRFDHELTESEIADLEAQGLVFARLNGAPAHSGSIYGADVPIGSLDALQQRSDVLRIESTWKPAVQDTLDLSVPEINADDVWLLLDGGGTNITGEGLTIANFDTGIDVFHPDFWNADGSSYDWIDTNTNGAFDPGTDAVDLNGNASADPGETLDFFDAQGPAGNNDGVFQADVDWLYNDADGDGQRDHGAAAGFTEASPTYGESLFILEDTNGNSSVDDPES